MFGKLEKWLDKNIDTRYIEKDKSIKEKILLILNELKHHIEDINIYGDNEYKICFKHNQYFLLSDDTDYIDLYYTLFDLKNFLSDELALYIMSVLYNNDNIYIYSKGLSEYEIIHRIPFLSDKTKQDFAKTLHCCTSINEYECKLSNIVELIIMNDNVGIVLRFSLYDEELLKKQIERANLALQVFKKYNFMNTLIT